jgi:AAHS family benzoate transporter-like MFS transporter
VFLLALLRFMPTFCYGMLTVFIPLLLRAAGAARPTIAFYAASSSVCASLAQLAAGRLADRLGPKRPATVAYLVLAGSALAVSTVTGNLVAVFALGAVGIASAWSLSTLMTTMVARAVSGEERGRALGLIHLFWNLGMILGALVGGFLFERWSGLPFVVGGVAVLPAPAVLLRFFRVVGRPSSGNTRTPASPSTP